MKSVNELLFEAFFAGFSTSSEGYNGEWLGGNDPTKDHIAKEIKERFDAWLKENDQ